MFLRALRLQSASSFHILIPVLMDGLEDRRFSIAPFGQNLLQAARGLDARRVMVQAEDGTPDPRRLLQHPQHRLFSHAAQSHIAVPLPVLWVQCQKGEQVDGRLEYIEPVAGPVPVETVPGIAALHIDAEGLAHAAGAPLVGMTDNAVLIFPNEHGVVIFLVLIDQSGPDKGAQHLPVDEAPFQEVGVQPPHLPAHWRLNEFLFRFLLLPGRRFIDPALLTVQQAGDRLRVAESKIILHKGDGTAALHGGVVVPFVTPDGDAAVAGHAVLRPGSDELLALPPQELHQVYTAGTIFLFLGEMDIGHIVGHLPRFSRFG